jgi:membrane protein DedA with SNARE-associated domain/diacylglycerol kinase family enzyme
MQPTSAHRPQRHLIAIGVAGALVAAAALLAVLGVVPTPDLDGALEDASLTLGWWAYPAVAAFAFLETAAFVGLLAPGETAVVVGGVVAARGDVELLPLIGLVWLAAAAGDLASFVAGRRLGRPFLERHGSRLRLGPERLALVESFYARHGGKAVLLGRFTGLVRAVSPFVAGASGLGMRRFLVWSWAGALLWAATFTLVGYSFSESFAESGQAAARIALAAALLVVLVYGAIAVLRLGPGGLRLRRAREMDDGERADGSERGAHERAGEHVEREVNAQVDPGEPHGGGDREGGRPQVRAEDRHGRGSRECGGAVAGRERGVVRDRGERAELGVGHGRARPVEGLLEHVGDERGGTGRDGGRQERERHAPAMEVRAEPEADEQRSLDPPRREHHEDRGEPRVLERRGGIDQRTVEIEQGGHRQDRPEASNRVRLLLVVNGRASGVEDPDRTAQELLAVLQELGADADAVVTMSEEQLWDVLRFAAARGRRVVLVGGDGTPHAAANAPLSRLPELALVPAGRANNIARALGIPTSRQEALAVAAHMPARPLDALRVATPDRFVYALEAVSAGFQAEARAAYQADNSSDLRQGLRALVRAIRRFRPYSAVLRFDDGVASSETVAQVFLSNLPYFGFGFEVDPGADPADGRFEAITLEARGRGRLLRLLLAARRGRHLAKRGVRRVSTARVQLTRPLPLVADAVPLGTTTATVSIEPARLRVAFPAAGVAA